MTEMHADTRRLIRRTLIAAGFALAVLLSFLFWQIFHAFMLIFAAVLFAVFLDGFARWLDHRIPRVLSVGLVITVLIALGAAFVYLAGPPIGEQFVLLRERLPQDLKELQSQLADQSWGQAVLTAVPQPGEIVPAFSNILSRVSRVFTTTLGAFTNIVIILVVGFYLAISPGVYIDSLIRLVPIPRRDRAAEVFETLGHALRWWLLGRMVAMTAVGVLTALGLWLIDMPLALALGFIAGLLSFVPYIGPIISAVPAVLIAMANGGLLLTTYVVAIYGTAQFLEGNFITPLTQKYSVSLPPAVLLIAQLLLGIQFGLVGILLATPLAVTLIVLIQMLYVQDVLGDSVEVLGDHHGREHAAWEKGEDD